MDMAKRYIVTYEKDPGSRAWTATIGRSQGVSCVTEGRSLGEARKRIRKALALYLDNEKVAAAAELVDDFKLHRHLKSTVAKAVRAREQSQVAQAKAQKVSEAAAKELTAAGLSTRDAAELLGISHQRIHQFAGKPIKRRAG
jgi:phage terminase Nu1 subunit (DNA packaging protein)